uniref:SPX domain-containing protein n=1 Tax=Aegilops tauschii subsp. strangulata TaxID=200361 RepID=A0A453Q024_AEGTS
QEREFLEKADEELEKVNTFYATQEAELLGRGEALIDQLRILADVKRILADHAATRRARGSLLGRSRSMPAVAPPSPAFSGSGRYLLSGLATPQSMSDGSVELQQAQMTEGAAVADEVMAALERNGVSFVGLPGKKDAKKEGSGRGGRLQLPSTVRIDIPASNPGRAALKVWEELVNVLRKDGADPAAAFVHRKKVQHAEKNIRDAFMALYRGLELLKKFSSLNVKAFTKILKKFVKGVGAAASDGPFLAEGEEIVVQHLRQGASAVGRGGGTLSEALRGQRQDGGDEVPQPAAAQEHPHDHLPRRVVHGHICESVHHIRHPGTCFRHFRLNWKHGLHGGSLPCLQHVRAHQPALLPVRMQPVHVEEHPDKPEFHLRLRPQHRPHAPGRLPHVRLHHVHCRRRAGHQPLPQECRRILRQRRARGAHSAVSRTFTLPVQCVLPLDALLLHAHHAQHHVLTILQGKGRHL